MTCCLYYLPRNSLIHHSFYKRLDNHLAGIVTELYFEVNA